MGIFSRKKREENVDPTFSERLAKLEARYTRIEANLLDLATAQDIIRNKVLRKIQPKKYEDDEESEKKPKDLYNSVLLPER